MPRRKLRENRNCGEGGEESEEGFFHRGGRWGVGFPVGIRMPQIRARRRKGQRCNLRSLA
jgi:hypothetical protein